MNENTEYYNLEVAFEVVDQKSFYKLMDKIKPLLCKKYDGFTHKVSLLWTDKAKERLDSYVKKDSELNNFVENYPENYIEYLAFKAAIGDKL